MEQADVVYVYDHCYYMLWLAQVASPMNYQMTPNYHSAPDAQMQPLLAALARRVGKPSE